MTSNPPNSSLDDCRDTPCDHPIFTHPFKIDRIKARNGREMGTLCNCCKTNTMSKGQFYCGFCKDFLSDLMKHHKQKEHNLWHNNNYYKNRYNVLQEELNRLKMQQGIPLGQKV